MAYAPLRPMVSRGQPSHRSRQAGRGRCGGGRNPMIKTIKRYSAYFRGWCLAFGEHEIRDELEQRFTWLDGEQCCMGLIVRPDVKKPLVRELLGRRDESPRVVINSKGAAVNGVQVRFETRHEVEGAARFRDFCAAYDDVHMYLTGHFCYQAGTRIFTFSPKKPPFILYKEIGSLELWCE
jgi:hypothetical protein